MDKRTILEFLKKEMMPAMGCTEPAAAALCGAKVHELLGETTLKKIIVTSSRDIIKNAMGVSIPSSNQKGVCSAVAIGYAIGSIKDGLNLLSKVDDEDVRIASTFNTELVYAQNVPSLFISVRAESISGEYAIATISGAHDRFSYIEKNNKILLDETSKDVLHTDNVYEFLKDLTFDEVVDFANSMKKDDLVFISDAIDTNMQIANFSLKEQFGLEVGKTMLEGISEPISNLKDAFSKGAALAAAGSDARMNGCPMPVIINSGSGNQGITVTVPVKVVAQFLNAGDEKTARAVCISELIGLILTSYKSRLSALCGVFTAAIGTACAWVYLLDGDSDMMNKAFNTMVGNLAGIICDGAKGTCALKIYSSLECASMSVRLALKGISPSSECGIVGDKISDTIKNLSRLCNEGMYETDKTVLSIMTSKVKNN